jgi:CheY-like chemotaxis protein
VLGSSRSLHCHKNGTPVALGPAPEVHVILPSRDPDETPPLGTQSPIFKKYVAGARVLVVDDDPETLRLMAEVIRAQGYEVMAAEGRASALVAATQARPEVVVLDLKLADGDGEEIARALRAFYLDVGLVIVSGLLRLGSRLARELGAAYVAKPFHAEELTSAVRAAIAVRR